nr:MAG TPA: hypothetical protein [Caudoviricetes sp.]
MLCANKKDRMGQDVIGLEKLNITDREPLSH